MRRHTDRWDRQVPVQGRPAVACHGLVCQFGPLWAVDDLSFEVGGGEVFGLLARLFDVPRRQRRGRVRDALASVGLEEVAGRLASTYSSGMVRRLELAQALVSRPRLLVLDEPTIGLDPLARGNALRELLLGQEGNLAVDFAALLLAAALGVAAASLLLGRLAR